MKMRCRRSLFALATGLLLAPLLLMSAQPASAQRPYGGRGMYPARQFRPQRVQAARPPHPQSHPQNHPQGSGAHPNANQGGSRGGNQGGNANHPNGGGGAGANQGGQHPNGNNYRPPTNANGAQAKGSNASANERA